MYHFKLIKWEKLVVMKRKSMQPTTYNIFFWFSVALVGAGTRPISAQSAQPISRILDKYWNQLKKFRKFRVVLSSGSHETGSTAKKVTASDSAKPGPHIHIFFFESGVTGTRRNGDKE